MTKVRSMAFVLLVVLVVGSALGDAPAPPPLLNGVVRGIITDAKGPTITLMNAIVIDTSNTRFSRRGKSVTFDALTPGTRITAAIATTKANKPNVLMADTITIDATDATLSGPLDAVSSTSIQLLGQQYAITSETFFGGFSDGKGVQGTADLKVGYPVEVDVAQGASGPTAVSITAIGPSPRTPQPPPIDHATMTGSVTAIDHTTWTVGGTTVYVIERKTQLTGSPGVGDTVRVEGLRTPEGAIIANTIVKQ